MKKSLVSLICMVTLLLFMTGSAMAYTVTLTNTDKPQSLGLYGDSGTIPYHNSTVFDFSTKGFDTIDSFKVDLTYSGARNQNWLLNDEYWRVRFDDGIVAQAAAETWAYGNQLFPNAATRLTGTSYTYTFDTSDSKFAFMDTDKAFTLWFAEESANSHWLFQSDNDQFQLTSVSITATGNAAVPIPAGILLLASGLLGFVGIRRRNS